MSRSKMPRRLESSLFASCAVGLALAAASHAPQAVAKGFLGTGTTVRGTASIDDTLPNRTGVTVTSDRAVINWTPDDTAIGGPTIDFLPSTNTVTFFRDGQDFTVLNRIVPTDQTRGITLNGAVQSSTNASVPNNVGNVWFYSPGGIAIGATATFDVGSLLLSTLDVDPDNFMAGGPYDFNGTVDSVAAITIAPGARINALNENSYVALIAPRIDQGGRIDVNGTASFVAAERATINMAGGLFAIDITRGTTAATAISHSGMTTGPGSTGLPGDTHAITMVAVPRNSAITMLVGGNLGYAASGAGIVNGVVQLYAGYDLPDGVTATADNSGFPADIIVGNTMTGSVVLNSDLTARASRDIGLISNNSGAFFSNGNVSLFADRNATLTASQTIDIDGNLTLHGGSAARALIDLETGYGATVDIGGNLLIDASVTGAAGGGTGTGGGAELSILSGSLAVAGAINVQADGIGGLGGGDGVGGTAAVSITDGFVDANDVTISANGFGNGSGNSPVLNGGDGTGGITSFTQTGGDFLAQSITLSADGTGGENDASLPGGTGGAGVGGDVSFARSGGTQSEITGGFSLSAIGSGGAATGTGGNARGGDISVGATSGTLQIDGSTSINASASGGDGVIASGSATGGSVTLFARNGGATSFANILEVFADATGGTAQSGTDALGGSILAYAEDGTLTLGTGALFSAAGTAGFNNLGTAPGTGRGGSITLESRATAANLSALVLGDFEGSSAGYGVDPGDGFVPASGNAGHGVGGTFTLNLAGGTLTAASLDIDASAFGGVSLSTATGPASTGGNATGGTAQFNMTGGSANIDSLSVTAIGQGGYVDSGFDEMVAGLAGQGTGGTASISATGGTLSAGTITLDAGGIGGEGAFSYDGSTSAGGAGLGGTARLTLDGSASVSASNIELLAVGTGGAGGDTGNTAASVGGAGTGGLAEFLVLGGTLAAPAVRINAGGEGGEGGMSQNMGAPAGGGLGTGGTARFFSDGDVFTIADLMIAARGQGGAGGFEYGYGTGGSGGTGRGGGAILELDFDPVIDTLLIDASGIGGLGGDGAIGGNGGDGFGGINTGSTGGANLNLTFGTLTVHNAMIRSDGTGGDGGIGSDGSGGNGGNGTGGDARILVTGADSILTLSPNSSRGESTLSAYGTGGNAGVSFGSGAAGAQGGNGRGGTARFDILAGGQVLAGPLVIITADGFGGFAGDGGGGAIGGGGGNGGSGTGGFALLNVDGGSLLPNDPANALDWTVNANGFGGVGGSGGDGSPGGAGGNGGVGRGGNARITTNNAVFALGSIFVDAEGFGGAGELGTNGGADGVGGDASGGTAAFLNSDDGTTPPTGSRSIVSLDLRAEGTGGLVADQPGGLAYAGRVELADSGSLRIGTLSASSRGLAGQAGAGFYLTSTGGALGVTGNADIATGGAAGFSFNGNGRLEVGGNFVVDAAGDVSIGHGAQPGTPVDSIGADQISFTTPGSFTADAGSVLRSGSSVLLSVGGNISAGNLFALDRITAYAGGNLTLGNAAVTAPVFPSSGGAPVTGVIDLIAGNGSNGFVAADITLTGTITATGHISAQAGRDVIVAGGASVISDNRITLRSGDDILVRVGALVRTAANPLPEFGYGASPLEQAALLDFNAGAIAVAPTAPDEIASIIIGGTIGAPGRAVTLTAGAIQADANTIDSANFYAQLRSVPAAGATTSNDGGQLRADCVAGNICLGALEASNIVQIGPSSGLVDLPAHVSVAGNIDAADITIRARDALAFNGPAEIHGADRLFLAVLGGDLTGNGAFALSGNNLINVYVGGSITAPQGSISAAGDLGLHVSGGIDLGTIQAGGLLQQIDSDGAVTQPNGLTLAGAFRANSLLAVGGGNVSLDAASGITIGTLRAPNGSALLRAINGAVTVSTDITTAAGVTASGQSIALTAIGDLVVTDALASSGAITLASTTGDLTLGTASAGTSFTANALGTATINGQVTAGTIAISSGDIAIGSGGQLGTIGRTTSVSLTNGDATRQTYIGGADTGAGYSLSAVEIGRIFGDSIGVTAPRVSGQSGASVGSSRAPDVIVGSFTLTGRAGGASGNLGAGGLRITTPGKLRVNGAVQLTGLTAANRFELTATEALEIDAASGSISLRDAANGFGGVLQLTSDDIIAASLQAIADVAAATTTDAIDDRLAINDGAVSDDGYFSANRIEANARGGFYVQNSGASDDFVDRRGFTVGNGGMAITTGGTATRIVINGRQSDGAGGFVTSVDLIDRVSINGQTGRAATGIDRRSTINGCLIANPLLCAGFFVPETPLSREIFEVPIDPESGEDALNQLFPLTLIELRDFEPFGFEPLIDEPITGAGNDDLWVPECDPATEQCEPRSQQ